MPKSTLSLHEKLEKLEKQKTELLERRKKEIFKIIQSTNAITINDQLLAGALLFLNDDKNKDHPIRGEFFAYSKKSFKPLTKATKSNNKTS